MPFRFYLFVLWRFVKSILIVVTCPVWVPLAVSALLALTALEWVSDVYSEARRDWVRKQ